MSVTAPIPPLLLVKMLLILTTIILSIFNIDCEVGMMKIYTRHVKYGNISIGMVSLNGIIKQQSLGRK